MSDNLVLMTCLGIIWMKSSHIKPYTTSVG